MEILNVGGRVMNTYVYRAPAGYIMIDTGYEHGMKRVERKLRGQGLALSEISYVFLTHAHDDHAGFLNELLAKYPHIRVIMSDKALPALLRGQNSFDGGCSGLIAFLFCKLMALAGKGAHRFPPIEERHLDRLIAITPENRAGLETVLQGKILFTPGHTPDSISLKVSGGIFCGDAAMNGAPSLRRVTIWMEDQRAFCRSWDVLTAGGADCVYPAHGKPFSSRDLEKYQSRALQVKCYKLAGWERKKT